MKPIFLQKNTKGGDSSFSCRYAEIPHTYNQFHYHNEYELLYNIENSGTRFIGDSIQRFENGDLVLVGPNVPHYWQSDDKYFLQDPAITAKVVLVQFQEDFAGQSFLDLPEMLPMKDLLQRARQGVHIKGDTAERIGEKLKALTQLSKYNRLLQFVDILCMMGETNDYELLASPVFASNRKGESDAEQRISIIFDFMVKNYDKEVSFKEIADLAHMNPAAFCRYFKKTTSKTFSEMMNEFRIGFACKKLINSGENISEIAYACGYSNISYFNRQFKRIKKVTPAQYRAFYKTTE